jgi:CheY-like chemotaxis protein
VVGMAALDVLVLDISMPGKNGIDALKQPHKENPAARADRQHNRGPVRNARWRASVT